MYGDGGQLVVPFDDGAKRLLSAIVTEGDTRQWCRAAAACIDVVTAAMETIKQGCHAARRRHGGAGSDHQGGILRLHRNRLGYSIGICYPPDRGEGEIISLQQHEYLQAGMTFHLPPLCFKCREFGIGFSDSIVLTESGYERFSKLPREIVFKV